MKRDQSLSPTRQAIGWGLAAGLLVGLTTLLVAADRPLEVATTLSLYLLVLVAVTAVGGRWPGLATAIAAPLVVNWYLIPPYHTLRISDRDNLIELAVFISVAVIVAGFVTLSSANAAEARQAASEARMLAELSESGLRDPLGEVLGLLCESFDFPGAAVLQRDADRHVVVASTGHRAPRELSDADFAHRLGSEFVLAVCGIEPSGRDRRVLDAFLGQLTKSLEQDRLRKVELEAESLVKTDELRTAILRAVSHDLRSPLASIKASVSSLRQNDVIWPDDVEADFLESIETQVDRLTSIVMNLLDLSRLEAGVLRPSLTECNVGDVVAAALRNIDADTSNVDVRIRSDAPDVVADPALLERVVANLVTNAIAWSGAPGSVGRTEIDSETVGTEAHLRIVDHGPGIPGDLRETVLMPFHRLSDSSTMGGLGLGLAIVDRLLAAMGGRLELHDTPGGGLTAVVILATMSAPTIGGAR